MIRKLVIGVAASASVLLASSGVVFATSTGNTGQPGQVCQSQPPGSTPGNSASAPGSPFNQSGNAGTHYAGTQPQNSKNPKSVSQYDVACFQQANH